MIIDIRMALETIGDIKVKRIRLTGDDHCMIEAVYTIGKKIPFQDLVEAVTRVVKDEIAFDAYESHVVMLKEERAILDFVMVSPTSIPRYVTGRVILSTHVV